MSDFDSALRTLLSALKRIPSTGEKGFEGFLCQALVEVTGQPFRVSKSGPQGGMDLRSERSNVLHVGLESKQYSDTTHLPLDALKSKLRESIEGDDPLDLWILATTRSISSTDATALDELGESLGVDVKILDWTTTFGALPHLAVLCALAPHTMDAAFPADTSINDVLAEVRNHSLFESHKGNILDRFARASTGYAATTVTMRRWIIGGLDDRRDALARLDGFNDIQSPDSSYIPRPTLFSALDTWWKSPLQPIALIGDEGHGKTWTALSWWQKTDEGVGGNFPVAIYLSARLVKEDNLKAAIAHELHRTTGLRDVTFWTRRVQLWLRRPANAPQFLVIIDGLDQKWAERSWVDFLQPAFSGDMRDRVGVVVTSRPDRWQSLNGLRNLDPRPENIVVNPLTDAELDALLVLHKTRRSEFPEAMIPLLKVPRLAADAIRLKAEMIESGDVTPERLAYEDWRSRLNRRGDRLKLSHAEFHDFVKDLGEKLRKTLGKDTELTKREMIDRLGKDSGRGAEDLATTVSEVVGGYWFQETDRPNQFRLNKELTPFALGFALSYDVRDAIDQASAEAAIAKAMDPFKGHDLSVAILRSATTIALLDREVPAPARIALLHRWLSERNFRSTDFDAFWRLIGADRTTTFSVLERIWLESRADNIEDEILIKGFSRAYQYSEVAETLRSRALTWLGWLWPRPTRPLPMAPKPGTCWLQVSERIQQRLSDWRAQANKSHPILELRETGDLDKFSSRVIGILSFLPRAPFIEALNAWALSRAIMCTPYQFLEVSWLIRVNPIDGPQANEALDTLVSELAVQVDPMSQQAAYWLARASGSAVLQRKTSHISQELGDGGWEDLPIRNELPYRPHHAALFDPTTSYLTQTTDGETHLSDLKEEQTAFVSEDKLPLSLRNFPTEAVLLSRREPRTNATAFREAIGQYLADHEVSYRLRYVFYQFALSLGDHDRRALRGRFADTLNNGPSESTPKTPRPELESAIKLLELWDASAEEQIVLIRSYVAAGPLSQDALHLLNEPDEATLKTVFGYLEDPNEPDKHVWLEFLKFAGSKEAIAAWPGLVNLIYDSDTSIRVKALELAYFKENAAVRESVAASTWIASSAEDRFERGYGSFVLVERHRRAPIPDISSRILPECFCLWLNEEPGSELALDAFQGFIVNEIDTMSRATKQTFPRFVCQYRDLRRAIDTLVAKRTQWAIALMKPYSSGETALPRIMLDGFPFNEMCGSLLTHAPEAGAELWAVLKDAQNRMFTHSDELDMLPFHTPNHTSTLPLKERILASATSDAHLFNIARAAQISDREDPLYEFVSGCLNHHSPGVQASAITLLGFANSSTVADELWVRLTSKIPENEWLGHVQEHANFHYRRNKFAQHWISAFREAEDDDDATDAYLLLRQAVDNRAASYSRDLIGTETMAPNRRRFWCLNLDGLNKDTKRWSEGFKKTLFFTRPAGNTQFPWI